jgi:hypothetical protein
MIRQPNIAKIYRSPLKMDAKFCTKVYEKSFEIDIRFCTNILNKLVCQNLQIHCQVVNAGWVMSFPLKNCGVTCDRALAQHQRENMSMDFCPSRFPRAENSH